MATFVGADRKLSLVPEPKLDQYGRRIAP